MIEIEFYRTELDKCPVEAYLLSLNSKQRAKVAWTLQVIRELSPIPGQYFQKLSGRENLWEARIGFGGDIFRLLGFYNKKGQLVLCHGFTKKTQKTPPQEIQIAEARKVNYEKRESKNG